MECFLNPDTEDKWKIRGTEEYSPGMLLLTENSTKLYSGSV